MTREEQLACIAEITKIAEYDVVRQMVTDLIEKIPGIEIRVSDFGHHVSVVIGGHYVVIARGTLDPKVNRTLPATRFRSLVEFLTRLTEQHDLTEGGSHD